jgi:ubiquinone/menaquinone biosynthesis C-methylase UbiE
MTREEIVSGVEKFSPWFYEFKLPGGICTPSLLPPQVRAIHTTRLAMTEQAVCAFFGENIGDRTALDIGCHEGYFSIAMAQKGFKQVTGTDLREESLDKARFVASALGLKNVSWTKNDCEDLSALRGPFDLTLLLGVLYHLENPMLCLRNIAALTAGMCLVETQVVEEIDGSTEWGAREWTRPYRGVMALIDETGEFNSGNRETGAAPLVMCPSPKAVEFMLREAGFKKVETLQPPVNGYEQHLRGKRLMFAAYK